MLFALLAFGPLRRFSASRMIEDERDGLPIPWPEDAPYTASYCEENVYLLAARYMAMTQEAIYVAFISNPSKTVSTTVDIPHSLLSKFCAYAFGHVRLSYLSPEALRSIQSREDSQLFGIIT
jgi:hypothetical protein